MISTVIFDLGEVQIRGMVGVEHSLEPALQIDPEKIMAGLLGEDLREFFHGKISEDEYWERVVKRTGWNIDTKTLKGAIRDNFQEVEGTREIIQELRANGFKLGLLSVHGKEWVEYKSEKFNHHEPFHSVLYSFEVGISKPDKRVYRMIVERLKSRFDECVFVDDNERNLEPAKELGMAVILFRNAGQLRQDLIALGVLKKKRILRA